MNKFRFFWFSMILLASSFIASSCDSDDDKVYVPSSPNAMVTVKPNSDNTACVLQLSDNEVLYPENIGASPFGEKEVRAYVNFTRLTEVDPTSGKPNVRVNWIDSILTKQTFTIEEFRENPNYATDPVEVLDSWETCVEDGYLTVRFRTRWNPGSKHAVNLVLRDDMNHDGPVLEFSHKADGDTYTGVPGDGVVAFRLPDYFNEGEEPFKIILMWKSYNGDETREFTYTQRKDIEF